MAHGLNWGTTEATVAGEAGRLSDAPHCHNQNGGNLRFSGLPQLLSGTGAKLGQTGANRGRQVVCPSAPVRGVFHTPPNWRLTEATRPLPGTGAKP
nr:MAG TPA_asm: hypothetical protein [Caudoviricetes sp.]